MPTNLLHEACLYHAKMFEVGAKELEGVYAFFWKPILLASATYWRNVARTKIGN